MEDDTAAAIDDEALRRKLAAEAGDDERAVTGTFCLIHEDDIAWEDAGAEHALAFRA